MKKIRFAALCTLLFAWSSVEIQAATRVVVLHFEAAGDNPYVVPAGKVLLIEHVGLFFKNSSLLLIEVAAPAENKSNQLVTIPWQFSIANGQTYTLARPLRVNAGSGVRAMATTLPNDGEIRIQGLLVDQADLYAANLDLNVEGVSVAQGRLTETVRLTSPRPAIFDSIVSSDLRNWVDNLSQIVTKSAQPGVYDVSTQLASSDIDKFLSASAKTPEIR